MIIGFFLTNNTETIFRSTKPLPQPSIDFFLTEFNNFKKSNSGSTVSDNLKYIYTNNPPTWAVLLTTPDFPTYRGIELMQCITSANISNIEDKIAAIDECINSDTFLLPTAGAMRIIIEMESQEEKIHDMIMKNKEMEAIQKQKQVRMAKEATELDRQLERVRHLELEMRSESIQQIQELKNAKPKKRVRTLAKQTRAGKNCAIKPVNIYIKEKLRMTMDKENNVGGSEVEGEICVLIKEEEYKEIEFKLMSECKLKFSPNLDKSKCKENIIHATKGFPINKNVTVAKWKNSCEMDPPISITFWPSELEDEKYQITLEYTVELPEINGLSIFIPKEKLKNILIEEGDAVIGETYIEWVCNSELKKGCSDTIEFTCSCFDASALFPIDVFFTSSGINSEIKVVNMKGCENYQVEKIFEVDKFTVIDRIE
ncbi:putative coatomer subunit delta [Astathelohania contejeani]|uniref:Coatomer subunit delta n=1 Tax=Astathelohania contejeani TaxID=164912 RepID=A0ABQ7I281_9MICR|nr:putative coatomer subunit delta [Thelohania contejeani]